MPSVRGRYKVRVALSLLASALASGALAGFAAGALALALGVRPLAPAWAVGLAVAAVVLDHVVPPLSIRKQVPQAWGRLLPPTTAAVLYGARLGPGPLTILNSWLWWAALVIGATTGAWGSAATGAAFAAGRVAVMLVAGPRAGSLRSIERMARSVVGLAAVAASLLVLTVAAPSKDTVDMAERATTARPEGLAAGDGSPTRLLPTADPDAAEQGDGLSSRLPNDAGAGFVALPEDPARGLGPLDLAVAAALEQDEMAERALLETRGFEAGYARGWKHPDGRTAYAAVYRFPNRAAAEAYQRDGTITLEGRGVSQARLEHPAGALAFRQVLEAPTGARVADSVAIVRDRFFALVIVTSPSSASAGRVEEALAVRVAALLEGSA